MLGMSFLQCAIATQFPKHTVPEAMSDNAWAVYAKKSAKLLRRPENQDACLTNPHVQWFGQNGFAAVSNKSFCKSVSVTGTPSILSTPLRWDSCQHACADSSNVNSVNFRNKSDCAAAIFFLAASSRYGYGSAPNSFNRFAAMPFSNSPLANTNGTGIVATISPRRTGQDRKENGGILV